MSTNRYKARVYQLCSDFYFAFGYDLGTDFYFGTTKISYNF